MMVAVCVLIGIPCKSRYSSVMAFQFSPVLHQLQQQQQLPPPYHHSRYKVITPTTTTTTTTITQLYGYLEDMSKDLYGADPNPNIDAESREATQMPLKDVDRYGPSDFSQFVDFNEFDGGDGRTYIYIYILCIDPCIGIVCVWNKTSLTQFSPTSSLLPISCGFPLFEWLSFSMETNIRTHTHPLTK
jgi:hypothetical protein